MELKSTEFFILLIIKSFGHYRNTVFISEYFALNWYIFVALKNKKLLLPLYCRLNVNLSPDCVKLIEYIASAVNVVSSNPYAGPLPRIKKSLFLISICKDLLISASKTMTFFPTLPSVNEHSERETIFAIFVSI